VQSKSIQNFIANLSDVEVDDEDNSESSDEETHDVEL